jgi:O-methyltransferase involved in polyketide biosynthesis
MFNNGLPGVEWTLLMPLLSRARVTCQYTTLLNDPKAVEIIECLSGKLSETDSQVTTRDFCMGARARTLDDAVKTHVRDHPKATIINLGAGFDSAFYRNDNGALSWIDIDLPEVIKIRKLLIPETDRSRCLACSILDNTWIQEVGHNGQDLFIIAGGVLPYFTEKEVKQIFVSLADQISHCEFIFDVVSKKGRLVSNRLNREAGYVSAPMKWIVNRHNNLGTWDSRVAVLEQYPLFAHIKRTPDFDDQIIRFMDRSDEEWNVSIVHLKIGG